jgi:hypothetical protein
LAWLSAIASLSIPAIASSRKRASLPGGEFDISQRAGSPLMV